MIGHMRANLDKKATDVQGMFNAVAKNYDLMNSLASLGQVRRWRKEVRRAVVTRPAMRVLDVAAGTGASSIEFVRAGADVVAVDFSEGMLEEGRRRHPEIDFRQADAMNLPFKDNSFDAVTTSFGLRNIEDFDRALREFYRVLRPGGHLVVCEFSRPTWAPFRALYHFFLGTVVPGLARMASYDAVAYDYLTESILDWPSQYDLAAHLRRAGFERLQLRNLSGGIVALHRGYKLK